MRVLFLAPEQPPPHRDYVRALRVVGASVVGLGHARREALDPELAGWLDGYEQVRSLFALEAVEAGARKLAARGSIDRVEAVDETLTLPAAELRRSLGVPGLSVEAATLCRDKTAMKEALRRAGVPCAASASVASERQAAAFAERHGFPLILKPKAGFASQSTYRVGDARELAQALGKMKVDAGHEVAIEEFVDGHEGFYDTLVVDGRVRHEFIAHYYPNVLEAMTDPRIAPQIATTNRVDAPAYGELKELGRKVIRTFGIDGGATHMEWFFGSNGLRFSEIGARPPGERLWDLHCAGNDLDLYREWASGVVGRPTATKASRRFAAGSVQVRPDRLEGVIGGYRGLRAAWAECGPWIFASSVPRPGTPIKPLRLGYLENVWFRLRHPDYDRLRAMMGFIAETVKVTAA